MCDVNIKIVHSAELADATGIVEYNGPVSEYYAVCGLKDLVRKMISNMQDDDTRKEADAGLTVVEGGSEIE